MSLRWLFIILFVLLFTAPALATQTELITNGDFSSGFSGWTKQGVDSWTGTTTNDKCKSCPYYAALGVSSSGVAKNNADGAFYQTVSIPANATTSTLSFWHYISTNETGSTPYDELYVTVRNTSGGLLANVATLSNVSNTTGYVQKTFNMAPYIGQTIRIRFGATTDSSNTTTFRIDDVSIRAVTPNPAQITIGPSSLNFGSVQVGTCSAASYSIQHVSGTDTATGTIATNSAFTNTSGTSFFLSNGQSKNVNIQFCPTSAGAFNGSSTINSSAIMNINSVGLNGTGFIPQPTTGAIQVNALLDGSPWTGQVNYYISGPVNLNGTNVSADFQDKNQGTYTLSYTSGGPSGATLSNITPSSSQTLSGGGIITFALNFASPAPPTSPPVINNVSPNPVTGSDSQQTVTLTGTDFLSGLTVFVTWTGGSKTLSSSQVVVDSTTQVRIFITTLTDPDTWTVRVTNPDDQQSNTKSFNVIAPPSGGVDYPGAILDTAHPYNYTPASRTAPNIRWVVIHTTEDAPGSDCSTTRDWFRESNNPLSMADNHQGTSAHYVICRDGTVYQMVRDHNIAHHAGNFAYNQNSIGIEHERHDTSNWTEAQFAASVALVQWLAAQYDIQIVFPSGVAPANPGNGTGIIGHDQVPDPDDPSLGGGISHKTDPLYWDWTYYQQLFNAACTYSLSQTSVNLGSDSGSGNFNLTADSGCVWSAISGASWITITSGNSGSGNDTVGYSIAANPSTSSRMGTITVQGQTFTITQSGTLAPTDFRKELAEYWAPVIYQKVNVFNEGNGLGGRADFITNFDFDKDDTVPDKNICGNDNWNNIAEILIPTVSKPLYPLLPYVYYDVKETASHWFIYYAIFYPRDWGYVSLSSLEHENDMEAMLFVIKRNGDPHGELIIIESMAHNIWMNYPIGQNITVKSEQGESDIVNNGLNRHNDHRYVAFIEARGHGIYFDTVENCTFTGVHDNWFNENDKFTPGVVYLNLANYDHKEPNLNNLNSFYDSIYKYDLINIKELWKLKKYPNSDCIYCTDSQGYEAFCGTKPFGSDNNQAHPPWTIPDYKPVDGQCPPIAEPKIPLNPRGLVFRDPKKLVNTRYDIQDGFPLGAYIIKNEGIVSNNEGPSLIQKGVKVEFNGNIYPIASSLAIGNKEDFDLTWHFGDDGSFGTGWERVEHTFNSIGEHKVSIQAIGLGEVIEFETTVTVVSPGTKSDLTVISLSVDTSSAVFTGSTIPVTFTVKNIGNAVSGGFNNRIALADTAYGSDHLLANYAMPSLAPNESRTVTRTVTIPTNMQGDYWLTVYADGPSPGVVNESNEINNTGSTTPEKITVLNTIYTISTSPLPAQGGTTSGGGSYSNGEIVILNASANPGYSFERWTENGIVVSATPTYTLIASADRTLVANFTLIPTVTYTLNVSATNGTVTKNPDLASYSSGSQVTLTASPNAGYQFAGWSGDENGNANPLIITMDFNKNITATFIQADTTGPDVLNLSPSVNPIKEGVDNSITISATIDDSTTGNSNITAAEFYIGDSDPGEGNGTPLNPVDIFDSPVEDVQATIDTSTWTAANSPYTVKVRGKDNIGNWGNTQSVSITVAIVAVSEIVLQPGPENGKDIWTTNVYSYAPSGDNAGGGLDNEWLEVGGWGDTYYTLIEFDLTNLPTIALSAKVELFVGKSKGVGTTDIYLDRITEFWDWKTQGTGSDLDRLWWADRPLATQWTSGSLPSPTVGQWYSIDITDLYNAWKDSTYPNYGIQLRPVSNNNRWNEFFSSDYMDDVSLRPKLIVKVLNSYPNISTSLSSHDFGNEEEGSTSPAQAITISNTGTADLVIGAISTTGTDASDFIIQNENCSGQTIAPSGTCTVDVIFSPASAGSKNAVLSISSNDPDTPTLEVPLSGMAIDAPNQYPLTIIVNGNGTATTIPSGIDCLVIAIRFSMKVLRLVGLQPQRVVGS
ncbi:MAG: hypothetical protein SCABRO_02775 [Candidatus Scalindua brodae]|uniref:N-acetylmuramoyl-L-alanine amidase n=1 Tax=Candidatus Scalindua brodae TaxID=237368 RepID=A0A0B0EHH5_9BACT|nr:MAG: hypothetical protein SCABRO_02775 [Candidatus Scalindua brodae]